MHYIFVRTNGQTQKVEVCEDGTINEATLRCFSRRNDDKIQLFRNGIPLTRVSRGDEFIFNLQRDWFGAEFELKLSSAQPAKSNEQDFQNSRFGTSYAFANPEIMMDPDKISLLPIDGDLASLVGKYALYYVRGDNFKRCAIPLTRRLAAIYWHGVNKSIKQGDEIIIRSWFDKNIEVSTRAVKILIDLDTIILQSKGSDLCDEDLCFNSIKPTLGTHYLLMGFSVVRGQTNHQSLSNGVITGVLPDEKRLKGSRFSYKFDSGGSIWSEEGHLMGMHVGVRKSLANRGGCWFVSISHILGMITDLVPPIADVNRDDKLFLFN